MRCAAAAVADDGTAALDADDRCADGVGGDLDFDLRKIFSHCAALRGAHLRGWDFRRAERNFRSTPRPSLFA